MQDSGCLCLKLQVKKKREREIERQRERERERESCTPRCEFVVLVALMCFDVEV